MDAAPDTAPPDEMIDAAPVAPWSTPQALDAVNSPQEDTDPEISADGLELFFASRRSGNYEIYRATRATTANPFGAAVLVTALSSMEGEFSPALADDGLSLYFDRDGDIYRAGRVTTATTFGFVELDTGLSSSSADTDPAVSADGLVAIVARTVSFNQGLYQLTRSSVTAAWSPALHLTELETSSVEGGPWLDASGRALAFHSGRAGSRDLFTATRASSGTPFAGVAPIAELNSMLGIEANPTLTADQRIMVFEMAGNLYVTTR